jgi:hypothetical protein
MRWLVGVFAAGVLAAGASHAGAAVLFSDNFDGDAVKSTGWFSNQTVLNNFTATSGTVDVISSNNMFGLTGTGNFIDLDGSSHQGGVLQSLQDFSFKAGDLMTVDFDVGGNEREGTDGLFGGFSFSGNANVADVTTSGFSSFQMPGATQQLMGFAQVASTAAFQHFQISFRAISDGSFSLLVGTDSNDNVGPLLESVTLTDGLALAPVGIVPEPASWALMIVGFGGVGAILRRRRAANLVRA